MAADGGMPLWQLALAGALNHGARQGIVKAIEYIRGLTEEDAREMVEGMSPDMAARFLNMWRAARDEETISA